MDKNSILSNLSLMCIQYLKIDLIKTFFEASLNCYTKMEHGFLNIQYVYAYYQERLQASLFYDRLKSSAVLSMGCVLVR